MSYSKSCSLCSLIPFIILAQDSNTALHSIIITKLNFVFVVLIKCFEVIHRCAPLYVTIIIATTKEWHCRKAGRDTLTFLLFFWALFLCANGEKSFSLFMPDVFPLLFLLNYKKKFIELQFLRGSKNDPLFYLFIFWSQDDNHSHSRTKGRTF